MGNPERTADRVEVDWRGDRLLTLADRWPDSPRAAIVLLHPTVCGVEEGHHLHQRLGRQALTRILSAAGIARGGRALDDAAVEGGLAVCTLVKRPVGREAHLSGGDVDHGRPRLLADLRGHGVDVVICPFEPAARAVAGRAVPPGVHPLDDLGRDAVLIRLAAPFAPAVERDRILGELTRVLGARRGLPPRPAGDPHR